MSSALDTTRFPGPAEPASEQVRRWIETPVEFWEECARVYGSVVALDLGSIGSVMLLSDPEHVKQVFQLPSDRFEVRHFNEHYRYVMGPNAVLLQDGESHMRQRKLLLPSFRHDQLLPTSSVVREIVLQTIARWPAGEAFNPRPDLHDIAFQVILHLVFGTLDGAAPEALLDAYRGAVLQQVGSWGPWRNFTRLKPRMRELISEEIGARRAEPDRPGLLTRLAGARGADGEPVTDAECEDHVFSMMIAGVDTAAVSLAWALYWLTREDGVRERLVAELAAAPDATVNAWRDLPYLHAVYSETLRMYPIVPTPSGRRLLHDTPIGEHTFPAGTTLVPCTYLVHRREALYPDGDAFVPERFLDRRFGRHEYFPFGGGVRICIGEMLAQIEFKVALATILARWELQPSDGPPVRPVRHGTLLAPADHLRVTVRPVATARPEGDAG